MTEIILDYSKQSLVKAIHDNWNTCMTLFFKNNPNTTYKETHQHTLMDNNLKIPMLNRVYHTNLTPNNVEQKISEIIEYFDSRKLPFNWQVDPGDSTPAAGSQQDGHRGRAGHRKPHYPDRSYGDRGLHRASRSKV